MSVIADSTPLNYLTLGVLRTAASRGLVHFRDALERLQHTNFYISADLLQQLLGEDDSSG